MNNYKKPYLVLFNGITDAIRKIENLEIKEARQLLVEAQQNAEEIILSSEEDFE